MSTIAVTSWEIYVEVFTNFDDSRNANKSKK